MPSPSLDYLLDEAARFRGYTASQWVREPWQNKARVLAHYLEHGIREGYSAEKMREKSDSKGKNKTSKNGFSVNGS